MPQFATYSLDVLAFLRGRNVIRTLAAAGGVAVIGYRRWWRDL